MKGDRVKLSQIWAYRRYVFFETPFLRLQTGLWTAPSDKVIAEAKRMPDGTYRMSILIMRDPPPDTIVTIVDDGDHKWEE